MPDTEPLHVTDLTLIAQNDHGYRFCVGRIGGRWCGCAIGYSAETRQSFMFLFHEIASRGMLGLEQRDEAIRQTAACAQDLANAYGGVDRWHVEERLRASPEEYRCENCGCVCCDGVECCDFDGFDPMDP